jgi:hypothetical protein
VSADQASVEKVISDIFLLSSTGGDLTAAQTELTTLFTKLSLNTTEISVLTDAIKSLSSALVSNPTAAQSTEILRLIDILTESITKFVESQSGLETFRTDSKITTSSKYTKFNEVYALIVSQANENKAYPEKALEYYTTKCSKILAQFVVLTDEASQNAAPSKYHKVMNQSTELTSCFLHVKVQPPFLQTQ